MLLIFVRRSSHSIKNIHFYEKNNSRKKERVLHIYIWYWQLCTEACWLYKDSRSDHSMTLVPTTGQQETKQVLCVRGGWGAISMSRVEKKGEAIFLSPLKLERRPGEGGIFPWRKASSVYPTRMSQTEGTGSWCGKDQCYIFPCLGCSFRYTLLTESTWLV